jgi:Na+-transporting NADH:ubiquinone oxidoreductase subunit NqrF
LRIHNYQCGPPLVIVGCKKMLVELGVGPWNIMFDDFRE